MSIFQDDSSKSEFIKESVHQCIDYQQRARDPPSRGGQKDYKPDGSWLEGKKLQNFHTERYDVLSEQRVRVKNVLSTAEWDVDKRKARVTHKSGKWWQRMGHHEDQEEWLQPEEATYLMDEGLLRVYDEGLPLSMEDAYGLMLAGQVPLQHYTVYAHLTRQGYILVRFTQPPEVTDYERKVGMEQVIKKQNKKRKRKISIEGPQAKQLCADDNGVILQPQTERNGVIIDNQNGAILDSSNNCTDIEMTETQLGNDAVDSSAMDKDSVGDKQHVELLESSKEHTSLRDKHNHSSKGYEQEHSKKHSKGHIKEQEHIHNHKKRYFVDPITHEQLPDDAFSDRSVRYVRWGPVTLPHFLPSVHRTVVLPVPDAGLLPPGVVCRSEAVLVPRPRPGPPLPPPLDFSFAAEQTRKGRSAGNWGEYKRQMAQQPRGSMHESPAAHYWGEEDITPLIHPADATSTGDMLKKLQIIPTLSPKEYQTREPVQESDYRIVYDMYKPDKNFTKTAPKKPVARICIVKDSNNVPDLTVINSLHQQCSDGIPIKFAVVEGGSVSLFSFDVVDLPVQITPLESCKV